MGQSEMMPPVNQQFKATIQGKFYYYSGLNCVGSVPFALTISDYYSEGYAEAAGRDIMDAECARRDKIMKKLKPSSRVAVQYKT